MGVAWEEGNLPPVAISFPHGLKEGIVGPFKVWHVVKRRPGPHKEILAQLESFGLGMVSWPIPLLR